MGSGHGQPPQLTLQALFRGLGFLLGGTDLDIVLDASLAVAIAMLVVSVLIYLGVIYDQTKSVRALYQAKHNVGQGNKGQQGATKATRDEGDESGTNNVTLRP